MERGLKAGRFGSNQVGVGMGQARGIDVLRFHFLLQQARSFLFQTDIQSAVAHQVTVSAGATKRLEQDISLGLRFFRRLRLPQTLESVEGGFQFGRRQVNRQKRQDQMKAVCVAPQKNEVVFVAEGSELWFTRVGHLPSPLSKCAAKRSETPRNAERCCNCLATTYVRLV